MTLCTLEMIGNLYPWHCNNITTEQDLNKETTNNPSIKIRDISWVPIPRQVTEVLFENDKNREPYRRICLGQQYTNSGGWTERIITQR